MNGANAKQRQTMTKYAVTQSNESHFKDKSKFCSSIFKKNSKNINCFIDLRQSWSTYTVLFCNWEPKDAVQESGDVPCIFVLDLDPYPEGLDINQTHQNQGLLKNKTQHLSLFRPTGFIGELHYRSIVCSTCVKIKELTLAFCKWNNITNKRHYDYTHWQYTQTS